jgi:hypothetical protein
VIGIDGRRKSGQPLPRKPELDSTNTVCTGTCALREIRPTSAVNALTGGRTVREPSGKSSR